MKIRDRIVAFRRVPARDLKPSPHNYRTHPVEQRATLRGLLREIGYADAVIARELPDGSLELIDGHMRADETPDQEIPVLVVDLDEAEALKLLATLDQLTLGAGSDDAKLAELLAQIEADDAEVRRLLRQMGDELASQPGGQAAAAAGWPGPPEMELLPHEHYDCLVVLARTRCDWNRLCELCGVTAIQNEHGKIGISRGIPADRLLPILEAGVRSPKHGDAADRGAQPGTGEPHAQAAGPAAGGDGVRRRGRQARLR